MSVLNEDLAGLTSAEDFFEFLAVAYDPQVVAVNRLHILKRFNTYLEDLTGQAGLEGMAAADRLALYRARLAQAYTDFVASSAREQKVFAVFERFGPAFVALKAIKPGPHTKA